MSRLPIPHIIDTIKTKLGFNRTMTASGEDVVDAVNKQAQQITKKADFLKLNHYTDGTLTERITQMLADLHSAVGANSTNAFSATIAGAGAVAGLCSKNRQYIGDILYYMFTVSGKSYSGYYSSSSDYAINDMSQQIKNLQDGLAYTENGDVSSRAYNIGDIIIWKGEVYSVISAIANSGVAFTTNNVRKIGTSGILNDLRSIMISESISVTVPANGFIKDQRIYFTCPDGYIVSSVILMVTSYEYLTATIGNIVISSGTNASYIICTVRSFYSVEELTRILTARITLSRK